MATQIIEVREAPPRRQFSDDDKARVVSEAMMPGSSVASVERRHHICASLIYRWRRELLGGAVYAFRGKRGDLVKLLWWDGQGLMLHASGSSAAASPGL